MIRLVEEKQLAKRNCFDKAVENTGSEMFNDFDFSLPSDTCATKITKAQARSSDTIRWMVASKMESTVETGQ